MTSSAFDLADFDDGPTVVTTSPFFHTQVMDRRQLPPQSGVMPVAQPAQVQPAYVAPSFAPPAARPTSSPDFTQPALRVRRDLAGTRRLAIGLAIAFAFVFGLAGAFVFQTMNANAAPQPVAARAPRSVTERSSTLDTRSTPDALPTKTDEAPLASAPRPRAKRPSAAPPVTTEAGDTAAASESDSIEGRDLLGEGLGAP
jgi:hypothetical protein